MQHHDEALERFVRRSAEREEVLGVLVTGSVARGEPRPDSDVDLVLVVTEEAWRRAVADDRIMVVETEGAEYPGGYFDVKLATLEQIGAAAERGDDPVRQSLGDARVAYDQGFDLDRLLRRIDPPPPEQRRALVAAQVAQARLHGEYFLRQGVEHEDPFLVAHAAVHLGLAAGRALLAEQGRLFPGPKGLVAALRGGPDPGPRLADAVVLLTRRPTVRAAESVLQLVERTVGRTLPDAATLSRFVADNELAWFTRNPPPEYR